MRTGLISCRPLQGNRWVQLIMVPLTRSFSRGDDGDGGGRLHRAPPNPSDVKINVEGAFIIDDESPRSEAKNGTAGEGVYFENKDIRTPHGCGQPCSGRCVFSNAHQLQIADIFCARLEDRLPKLFISHGSRILQTKGAD